MSANANLGTLVACTALLAGCGAVSTASTSTSAKPTSPVAAATLPPGCERAVRRELVSVVRRIYAQGVAGRNETAAVARIGRSTRLAKAVAAGDAVAAQAAIRPLLRNQITALEIRSRHGRPLARFGTADTYAPASGPIISRGRVVGRFVLSVSNVHAFESLVHGLTGITATFGRGRAPRAAAALPATAFPRGRRDVSLVMPTTPASLCGRTAADTRANTIGFVGRNLVVDEAHGPGAARTVRHAQRNTAFRDAIIAGDPVAVRAAIVGFFQDSRYHVVRVRAWRGSQLINDVGGPYVLNPAVGTIHGAGGRVEGRFALSIQDDTGYIKLMHRFTGADVVLHAGNGLAPSGTVPGSNLTPGPDYAPGLRRVTYRGRRYRAFGLTGTAFPAQQLKISLLVG